MRAGQISSCEATRAVLDALDGPGRGCRGTPRSRRALAAADEADRSRLRGEDLGPARRPASPQGHVLSGGPARRGAAMMRGHRPDVTATVLARLDAAGAIDVGRLNMVEFALGGTGHNQHTASGNPWIRRASPAARPRRGGAVAEGTSRVHMGSDTGGSIRIPAPAMVSSGSSRPGASPVEGHSTVHSLDHIGPLARTPEDSPVAAGDRGL